MRCYPSTCMLDGLAWRLRRTETLHAIEVLHTLTPAGNPWAAFKHRAAFVGPRQRGQARHHE